MSVLSGRRAAVALVVGVVSLFAQAAATGAHSARSGAGTGAVSQPWRNPDQPALTRANELLAALTRKEKIQLALGKFAALTSFGVAALSADDGPDGIRKRGTTAMPAAQSLAATFDRALAFRYGQVVGGEARAKGFGEWLGPAVDIDRTPLGGRQPEAEGEDPFLAGHMAAEEVLGAKSAHVIATLKHYSAYDQEWGRIGLPVGAPGTNVIVSDRALQEIYEAPFRTAVQDSGADAVMCSFNQLNGLPSCQNPVTLGDLKAGDGLAGFVVPDAFFAVSDPVAAALAGVDLPTIPGNRSSALTAAVFTSGQIPASRLDDIVRRVLFAIFDSGLFDNPLPRPANQVSTPADQQLATRVAEGAMVLLKNQDHALPLSGRVRSLAVVGPSGEDAMFVSGGSAGVPLAPGQVITPLAGISARAGSRVRMTAAQGSAGDVPAPTIVPASALTPSSGSGPGLRASYWSNADFSGAPVLTRIDPTVDLTNPTQLGPQWSARWTGALTATTSGLYRFSLLEAGIATLTIAHHTFGPAYREATQFVAGPSYQSQGTVRLTAGVPVPIEIDYSSASGLFSQEIHFAWQQPSDSGIPAAVAAARQAQIAVVFANDAQGEGMDRTTLALPGDQDQLIEAVAAANPRTIVVLNTGGPVLMPWLDRVQAVLESWYPGQQFGAALAAVLFGDAEPGGRLPVTFPASDEQGPAPRSNPSRYPGVNGVETYAEGLDVGYRWYDATGQRPLFPFGYGLSYADFHVSDAQASYDPASKTATVTARVTDRSPRAGSTTIELYLTSPPAAHEPPKQLRGYQKVALGPGRTTTITFRLHPSEMAYYNDAQGQWALASGRYAVLLGTSSTDLAERAEFLIDGPSTGS